MVGAPKITTSSILLKNFDLNAYKVTIPEELMLFEHPNAANEKKKM